jgi:signal transduction histidine kinase
VQQLDRLYPHLKEEEQRERGLTGTIGAPVEHLDLATVIKVSQAVSGEIILDRLLDTLMRTAIEQAGAERGLLIVAPGTEQRIVVEARTSADDVIVQLRDQTVTAAALPASVLHYVLHTKDSVALEDATAQEPFSADPYVRERQARSILCLPLLNQAKLIGVLYLENNLAPRVFASGRIQVLKLLASQAAISLENTRLYRDLAEREARYREVQMQLAHANRVATMGQLTASIAHEVNQPIAAALTNAQAALRWLAMNPPDLGEVRQALDRIVKDGRRAGGVIDGMRALIKKAPPSHESLDINEALDEVIVLTRAEAVKNGVSVRTQLAEGLPAVQGARSQLQQVILNLIINAIEAMSEVNEGPRELQISTGRDASDGVLVTVRDSGPGLAPAVLDRVFEAFYTTKPTGLGVGLSICRSIIEAHGGRLWASASVERGAAFQFTLPSGAGS